MRYTRCRIAPSRSLVFVRRSAACVSPFGPGATDDAPHPFRVASPRAESASILLRARTRAYRALGLDLRTPGNRSRFGTCPNRVDYARSVRHVPRARNVRADSSNSNAGTEVDAEASLARFRCARQRRAPTRPRPDMPASSPAGRRMWRIADLDHWRRWDFTATIGEVARRRVHERATVSGVIREDAKPRRRL